jgi:hypothetical protein
LLAEAYLANQFVPSLMAVMALYGVELLTLVPPLILLDEVGLILMSLVVLFAWPVLSTTTISFPG